MKLDVSTNCLTELPSSIKCLVSLTSLNISDNYISKLPEELYCLENLEVLKIDQNPICELDNGLSKLLHLKEFTCTETDITGYCSTYLDHIHLN